MESGAEAMKSREAIYRLHTRPNGEVEEFEFVQELVRCKECKFWVEAGNESFGYAMFCEHDCSLGGQGIKKPNDFCSYGERNE